MQILIIALAGTLLALKRKVLKGTEQLLILNFFVTELLP